LTQRTIGVSGGFETVGLTIYQIPQHTHGGLLSHVPNSPAAINEGDENAADYPATTPSYSSTTNPTGNNASHNNMPPYYVLIYIMKTDFYDFSYNYTVPTAPIIL
jgi:microcystin-dependent protein